MSPLADYGKMFDLEGIRADLEVARLQHRIVVQKHGCTRKQLQKMIARYGWKTCRTGPRAGPHHPEWKGGRIVDGKGYVLVWVENHPFRRKHNRYLYEHRVVMEETLGRYLLPGEVVHHIDANPGNNQPENLKLYVTNAKHLADELKGRVPKWTPEGRRRIREGVRQRTIRQRLKRDEQENNQAIDRWITQDASNPQTT